MLKTETSKRDLKSVLCPSDDNDDLCNAIHVYEATRTDQRSDGSCEDVQVYLLLDMQIYPCDLRDRFNLSGPLYKLFSDGHKALVDNLERW